MKIKPPLFACVHNSERSQMAETFARHYPRGAAEFESAGTIPGDEVNPLIVEAMQGDESTFSIGNPKLLTHNMVEYANTVLTIGCSIEDACPALQVTHENWQIDGPEGKPIEEIRNIHDQIEVSVRYLVSGR